MAITKATASSVAPAAKGDLVVGSATNDAAVLGVGSNDQVLTADSTTATGLKWATAGGAGANWSAVNSGGTALSGSSTVTVSGISAADKIMVIVREASSDSTSNPNIRLRFNTDTGSNYNWFGLTSKLSSTSRCSAFGVTYIELLNGNNHYETGNYVDSGLIMTGANSSGVKSFQYISGGEGSGGGAFTAYSATGWYNSSSTISSISVITTAGNFDAGYIYVFKSA